jgi:hypothetical protein
MVDIIVAGLAPDPPALYPEVAPPLLQRSIHLEVVEGTRADTMLLLSASVGLHCYRHPHRGE